MADIPSIRWGIITTGLISGRFVEDLVLDRPDAPVRHIVQAIGSSSLQKAEKFVAEHCSGASPKLYSSYEAVYADTEVDVIYIGTPHAFHKKNCLDAIAAGKPVLCEKAFTLNRKEAEQVFQAAKEKNVYVHEAMWLRHRPLVRQLRKLLYEDQVIGNVFRVFADFGLEIDVPSLPADSRYKDINLGAGTLLDLGIYPLTWAVLTLDAGAPDDPEQPRIAAFQTHQDGVEVTSSVILHYRSTGRQGIVTSSTMASSNPDVFAVVQGTNGFIEVEGPAPSVPLSFSVYPKQRGDGDTSGFTKPAGHRYDFPRIGRGFVYEADATALDIIAGRKENSVMPWSETLRMMSIMDEIRKQGGTVYPVDQQ